MDEIVPSSGKSDHGRMMRCAAVEKLCKEIKSVLGHHPNGSFGIASPHVSAAAHACYEIKKVLEREIAMFRDPKSDFSRVDYDGLWRRYCPDTVEPKATVEAMDGDPGRQK